MNVGIDCYQSEISQIAPGTIFVSSIGQTTTFCIAVVPNPGEEIPAFIALFPGHPMLRNQMGILAGSTIRKQPILVYPHAVIIPSPKPEHMRFYIWQGAPVGALLLSQKELGIVAATGSMQKGIYSCSSGASLNEWFHSDNVIIFTSWEISIEGPGGEPHILCDFDVTEAKARTEF